jgi:Asp-tRNA(Asn)/Glu-tRNA(Gln) amidotransferase A subunit family amidase
LLSGRTIQRLGLTDAAPRAYPHDEGTYPLSRENLRAVFSDLESTELERILHGSAAKLYDFDLEALARLGAKFGRTLGELFEEIDVLVTPTLATSPGPLGALGGGDLERFIQTSGSMTAFTYLVNLTGQSAMSLPLDQLASGIPIGSQGSDASGTRPRCSAWLASSSGPILGSPGQYRHSPNDGGCRR